MRMLRHRLLQAFIALSAVGVVAALVHWRRSETRAPFEKHWTKIPQSAKASWPLIRPKYNGPPPTLPVEVEQTLLMPREALRWETFTNVSAVPAEHLNHWFATETDTAKKRSLVVALGFYGNSNSVSLLIGELLVPRLGETLSLQEEVAIYGMVLALGFLAATSDQAWDFLLQAINPYFWAQKVDWRPQTEADWKPEATENPVALLSGNAIKAIALSGRPDAHAILQQLKSFPLEVRGSGKYRDVNFEHSLVDAAFALDYIESYGIEKNRARYVHGGPEPEDYFAWRDSERGRPWAEWLNSRRLSRGEPEIPIPFPFAKRKAGQN
jgi:hypothetical protein